MNFFKPKVTSLVKKNQFLPNPCKTNGDWIATDSYQKYQEHLKTMPEDWYYRTNTVEYKVNRDQYRTQEFNQIDWSNSIVMLGCSQVYGVGIDEKHTIGNFLQEITGKNVVNLGVPGASNNLIANNSVILSAGYPTPLAVVHMYTGVDRSTYYHKREIKNHGSWTLAKNDAYMSAWSEDYANAEVHTLMASKTINQVWGHKTKLIEVTNFTNTYELLKCTYLKTPIFKDYARDRMHFGFTCTKMIAEQIAKDL